MYDIFKYTVSGIDAGFRMQVVVISGTVTMNHDTEILIIPYSRIIYYRQSNDCQSLTNERNIHPRATISKKVLQDSQNSRSKKAIYPFQCFRCIVFQIRCQEVVPHNTFEIKYCWKSKRTRPQFNQFTASNQQPATSNQQRHNKQLVFVGILVSYYAAESE